MTEKAVKKLKVNQLGRKFRPQGAILNENMDKEHWLTVGCGDFVQCLYNTEMY